MNYIESSCDFTEEETEEIYEFYSSFKNMKNINELSKSPFFVCEYRPELLPQKYQPKPITSENQSTIVNEKTGYISIARSNFHLFSDIIFSNGDLMESEFAIGVCNRKLVKEAKYFIPPIRDHGCYFMFFDGRFMVSGNQQPFKCRNGFEYIRPEDCNYDMSCLLDRKERKIYFCNTRTGDYLCHQISPD